MKIFLILWLSVSAFFADSLIFSEEEKAWIQKNRNVQFTGDPNWLPYEAFSEKGDYIGMVADHLDLIEDTTGLNFVPYVVKDWSETLTVASQRKVSVVSGDIADIVLNKNFRPIDPYLINPIIIIMKHDKHYIESLESLKGKKIAVLKDYGYTSEIFESYPDLDFIAVENIQEGLRGVSNGNFDAILASQALALYAITKMELDDLKIVGKTSVIMSVTLFIDKTKPLLHSIINKAMHSVSSAQQLKISNAWVHKDEKTIDLKWFLIILFISAFIIFIVLKMYRNVKKSKQNYKFALEGSTDAPWNWDIQNDKFNISDSFKEILGEDKDCACNYFLWTQRIHPDDLDAYNALIQDNLQGRTDTFCADYRMQHKDGSYRWIRTRAKTFYDAQGKALRMDGVCSDITTEKELDIELSRSRQLLRTIIDNVPVRIFWKDRNGVYLGYNRLFAKDIDDNEDYTFIGKTDYEMPWKEEAQGYIDDDKIVISTGTAKLDIQEQQTTPDGHKIWLSTSKVPLLNDEEEVSGLLGVYYDITEHKQHLLENEKTTKRLESAQEISHIGSWDWDMISGALTWSDEVYRIFGEEPQSFPATYEAFTSYIPQEYLAGLEETIGKAIENKAPYLYDHEVRRKDGTIRLVREAGYVRYDKEGTPISMLGTILDINTIVQAEEAIRENSELIRRLQKFDENIIASNTDLKGVITYASEAFSDISGYSIDELVGTPQSIVRHEDTPKEVFEDLWKTIQSGDVWQGELKNRAKNGVAYWVKTTVSPIFSTKNEIIGYSSIRRDITHEKQVQELHHSLEKKSSELQTLNRDLEKRIQEAVAQSAQKDHLMAQQSKLASMGEMIGNIAHQWRQPLNALSLLLQKQQIFFERGLLTPEKLEENVTKGISLINKMSSTIDDFRDFFKPNKEKSDFDIKEAVESTLELIDATLHNANIDLEIEIKEGLSVNGYKNEFSQVILNLINNARDVLVEKKVNEGKIKIFTSISDDGSTISLHVSDNGGGIPEPILNQIFEPYFTTKEEGKGTGIGLYMSKMIIEENMQGKVSATNSEEGAVFTISVALAKKQKPSKTDSDSQIHGG